MTYTIDQTLRGGRPTAGRGWARSAEGQHVLDDVLRSGPRQHGARHGRRWLRPVLFGVGGLGVLAGAGAAAVVALAPEPPPNWKVPGTSVACAAERNKDADLAILRWTPGADPVPLCRQHWVETTGKAPDRLYACVFKKESGDGGGVVVIPGTGYGKAANACATIGMFVAPADLEPAPADPSQPARPVDRPGTQSAPAVVVGG